MSILQFGYENRWRGRPLWHTRWLKHLPRPVDPLARLRFLVTLRSLRRVLPALGSGRILDAGAKHGHLAFWLARFYPHHVVALDIDSTAVAQNQELVKQLGFDNLEFLQRDLARPLDLTGQFDLVVSYHVLEHIEADVAALENLYEVVAPGGTLFILVPGGRDRLPDATPEKLRVLDHVRAGYMLHEISDKVASTGFAVTSAAIAVGLMGTWARKVHYALCLTSNSFFLKGAGWVIASALGFLEYGLALWPKWDVLIVARKERTEG